MALPRPTLSAWRAAQQHYALHVRSQSSSASRRIDFVGKGGVSPMAIMPRRATAVPSPPHRPRTGEYLAQARFGPLGLAGFVALAGGGFLWWVLPADYISGVSAALRTMADALLQPPAPAAAAAAAAQDPPPSAAAAALAAPAAVPAVSAAAAAGSASSLPPPPVSSPTRTWAEWAGLS